MQKGSIVSALLLGCSLPSMRAEERIMNQTSGYQTATVVSVDRHTSEPYYNGGGVDTPLRARTYAYDIGIRLDCNLYIGRYESATKYLPSVFAPSHQVDVRLRKHILYISLSLTDEEVSMGIVGHRRVKDETCSASSPFSRHTVNPNPQKRVSTKE